MMREEAGPTPLIPRPAFQPTRLTDISPLLKRMVIIGEDSRFRTHHGIDFVEIGDALGLDRHPGVWPTLRAAWRGRDRIRGASTITQQLAKNLYLSPSRNPLRKLKEAVTAVRLELALPKDRILELYLNVVQWGPAIWGWSGPVTTTTGCRRGCSPKNRRRSWSPPSPIPAPRIRCFIPCGPGPGGI